MSTKVLYIIIAVLVLGGLGLYLYQDHQQPPAPAITNSEDSTPAVTQESADTNQPAANTAPAKPNVTTPAPSTDEGHFSDEAEVLGQAQVYLVTYDGKSFSPASLTIKAGDIVVFKNQSNANFEPASDPHPSHTNYPEFDSDKPLAPGANYEFKFLKVGTWGYHNHLNPSATGKIIVK